MMISWLSSSQLLLSPAAWLLVNIDSGIEATATLSQCRGAGGRPAISMASAPCGRMDEGRQKLQYDREASRWRGRRR
ncbi:hypothetical protein CgunFtcFv8_010775 [Champsocephalus gunnari]|uniref:Secreted protein n=1 Tax=Champsocephalus gunnari TaxID=52237 RepID=A0AAN8DVL6_CHAGU|nr:hypothetical protein CgunFtcFv8_010775 [Champsocephalus gunnari]